MNFGDILVAKGLVSAEDIGKATVHQKTNGGRLGDSIVALGLLTKEQIDDALADAPQMPLMVAGTGVDPVLLLELAIKGMYTENIETASQLSEALKLSSTIVNQLLQEAKERKLVETMAASATGVGGKGELRLVLTRSGREWAADALKRGQYFGPAPVSLAAYQDRILRQRVTNEVVTRQQLDQAFATLVKDLSDRGLFDSTLIMVSSEFGRTPKINGTAGRDHWPKVFSVVLAGGGIKKGSIYGTSDATATEPEDDPLTVEDLAMTVYKQLGIDGEKKLMAPGNRPIDIVREGAVRKELIA